MGGITIQSLWGKIPDYSLWTVILPCATDFVEQHLLSHGHPVLVERAHGVFVFPHLQHLHPGGRTSRPVPRWKYTRSTFKQYCGVYATSPLHGPSQLRFLSCFLESPPTPADTHTSTCHYYYTSGSPSSATGGAADSSFHGVTAVVHGCLQWLWHVYNVTLYFLYIIAAK